MITFDLAQSVQQDTSHRLEYRDQRRGLIAFAGTETARRLASLPALPGGPIKLEWAPELRVVRGRLRTGGGGGKHVYAASYIRERRIVFDDALRLDPGEMSRILVHEIGHFAWIRLANATRASWRHLLTREFTAGARGELGWSAEIRKAAIRESAAVISNRAWSEYSCESFCDTAAWHYCDASEHEEFTLAHRYRERRRAWFDAIKSHPAGGLRI